MIKKLLSGAAIAATLFAFAAPASATIVPMSNWKLDSNGASNAGGLISVAQYLDITGTAFVHNTFTNATNFTFNEAGTFNVFSADQNTSLNPAISATFTGTGSGNTGGSLSFNAGGILTIYSGLLGSGGVQIGQFQVLTGSANLAANSTLPNGTVSIIFQATSLAAGYWFDSANTDLSTLTNVTLGFATTNAIPLMNQDGSYATANSTNQNLYTNTFGANATGYQGNGTTNLVISNNGQYQLANNVPEPASMALVGLGLIGAAFARRRKA